ncbi:MAG: hypothetical protein PVI90_17860 [Desulfobacteraceae bacterium]|jgi:hypothetical protein
MAVLKATVSTIVNVDQTKAFETIVPIDLSAIFTGYGLLPAVTAIQDQMGAWNSPGQTRTVRLADGSKAKEMLSQYSFPEYFSYTIIFTGILGCLATSADGKWWFESRSPSKTHIEWHYVFYPRSVFLFPLLWFIKILWQGYMQKALFLSKGIIEKKMG